MSWDVKLYAKVGKKECPLAGYTGLSYTRNVSPMFREPDVLGENGICGLDGMRCRYAAIKLRKAIHAMKTDAPRFNAMIPKNGWGTPAGALQLLETLLQWCTEVPSAFIRVF